MKIGETIRAARTTRGITQNTLAALIYVTPQAISKWENNVGLPDVTQIVPLAFALGITTDKLLDAENKTDSEWQHLNSMVQVYEAVRSNAISVVEAYDAVILLSEQNRSDLDLKVILLQYGVDAARQLLQTDKARAHAIYDKCCAVANEFENNKLTLDNAENPVTLKLITRESMIHLHALFGNTDKAEILMREAEENSSAPPYRNSLLRAEMYRDSGDIEKERVYLVLHNGTLLDSLIEGAVRTADVYRRLGMLDEAKLVIDKVFDLAAVYYSDAVRTDDAAVFYHYLTHVYITAAAISADSGEIDSAFEWLERMFKFIYRQVKQFGHEEIDDSLLLRGSGVKLYFDQEKEGRQLLLSALNNASLEKLRSDSRFGEMLKSLDQSNI